MRIATASDEEAGIAGKQLLALALQKGRSSIAHNIG